MYQQTPIEAHNDVGHIPPLDHAAKPQDLRPAQQILPRPTSGPIDLGQSSVVFSDLITVSGQQKNIPPSREVSGGGSEFGDRRKTAKIHFRLISQKRRKTANEKQPMIPANENTVVSIGLYTHND